MGFMQEILWQHFIPQYTVLLAEAPSLIRCWVELRGAGDLILAGVMWLQGSPLGHVQQDGTGWP